MCVAAPAAMAVLSGIGKIVEYRNAKDAARSQQEANNKSIINATRARDLKVSTSALRLQQEAQAQNEKKFDSAIEAMQLKSKYYVSALEDGIAGRAVQAGLQARQSRQARNESRINTNIDNLTAQTQLDRRGLDAELENRINSMPDVQTPSLLGALIGTGASAGQTYAASGGKFNTNKVR